MLITNKHAEEIGLKITGNAIISKDLLEYIAVYVKSIRSIKPCTHNIHEA